MTLNYFGNVDNEIGQIQVSVPWQEQDLKSNFYDRIVEEPVVINKFSRPRRLNVYHLASTPKPVQEFPDFVPPPVRLPPKIKKSKEPKLPTP